MKEAKAAAQIRHHVLTQEAAQQASSSKRKGPDGENLTETITPADFRPVNVYVDRIYSTHPPNVKYEKRLPVFLHPTDPNSYIPLTAAIVQQWANALVSFTFAA